MFVLKNGKGDRLVAFAIFMCRFFFSVFFDICMNNSPSFVYAYHKLGKTFPANIEERRKKHYENKRKSIQGFGWND